MSKALVTFAVGDHRRLQDVAQPTLERFADRHNYKLVVANPVGNNRPPSWWKVPLLERCLLAYDLVLWVDADVVIVDSSKDPAEWLEGRWQGLVKHRTPDGEVPNCGVWLVTKPMHKYLRRMWDKTEHVNHPWWEQAAMLDLLGYRHRPGPCVHEMETELYRRTAFLPLEFNSHEQNDRHPAPRFAHVTPNTVEWRLPIMAAYAEASS